MRILCAILCAAVLGLGWLYHGASSELDATKAALDTERAVNEANAKAFARMERSMDITDGVMAGWNADRTTLTEIRATTRQTIREAMKNDVFKNWASHPVPPDAWRLLRQTDGKNTVQRPAAPGGADAGLPGNAHPGGGQ